jgi:hypothetical protein
MFSMSHNEMPPEHKPGFKMYRAQQSFEFPQTVYEEVEHSLQDHTLYNARNGRVALLRRYETDKIISSSRTLSSMPVESLVKAMFAAGRKPARENFSLPLKQVGYRNTLTPEVQAIYLLLDDETGRLETERETYLRKLSKIGRVSVPRPEFLPEIMVGHIQGAIPASTDIVDLLTPHLPDNIILSRVLATPSLSARARTASS